MRVAEQSLDEGGFASPGSPDYKNGFLYFWMCQLFIMEVEPNLLGADGLFEFVIDLLKLFGGGRLNSGLLVFRVVLEPVLGEKGQL